MNILYIFLGFQNYLDRNNAGMLSCIFIITILGTSSRSGSSTRKKSPAPSPGNSRRGSLRRPSLFAEDDQQTGISLLQQRAPSPSMKLRRGRPSLGGRTLTTVSCNFEFPKLCLGIVY